MAQKQKKFHMVTEALGIVLGGFLLYVSLSYSCLPLLIRLGLGISGITGMIIDTYCLGTWNKKS